MYDKLGHSIKRFSAIVWPWLTTYCAHTLSESLNHFSNPTIQHPFLYSLYPPSFPLVFFSALFASRLPRSILLILFPSVLYEQISFFFGDQSFTLISPCPLPFSSLWNHPSFLSLCWNLQQRTPFFFFFFVPCPTFSTIWLTFLVMFVPSAHLLLCLSQSLWPPLYFPSQSDVLAANPSAILTGLYLTS